MQALKRFGALSLAILTLSTSGGVAYAQDADWDTRLNAALEAPYPNDQVEALKALYNSETDNQNKLVSAYWIAVIAKDLKRYDLAAEYGEVALELSDKYSKGSLQQRDAIVAQLVEIYFHDEKQARAVDIIDANLALNDAMIEDIWAETENGLIHRYSGLKCPNRIGDLYREKTHNFHPTGIDVGCSYKVYNGEDNHVSIYLTKEPNDGDTRTPHQKAMAAVNMNWGNGETLKDAQILDIKTGAGTDITESLIRIGSIQKGYRYTGTWTSDLAGWTLKSRITWDGSLKQNFGERQAKALLEETSRTVLSNLNNCKKIEQSGLEGSIIKSDTSFALNALSLISLEKLEQKLPPKRPKLACLKHTSNEGNVVLESYNNDVSSRIYSFVGDAVQGDIYLYATPKLSLIEKSNIAYALRQDSITNDRNKISRLLAVYDGLPSPFSVFSDYIKIYSGDLKLLGSVEQNENGEMKIKVTPTKDIEIDNAN